MISSATKMLLNLTVLAAAGAVAAGVGPADRVGVVLFSFLSFAALCAALTVVGSGVDDIPPVVPADAPPPERNATTPGPGARSSMWPLVAALAVGLVAVGVATEPAVAYVGVIACMAAAVGWFGKAWTDHPSWTPRFSERMSDRLVAPVGLPVGGFLLVAFIAIAFSRTLLAVSKNTAVWLALVAAVVIAVACWWVASRPRMASSVITALAVLAAVATVGMGVAGAVQGEREFHHAAEHHEPLVVVARNTQFTTDQLTVKAGEHVVMEFVNRDHDIFHNVAVYEGEGPTAAPIFNGDGFPGEGERTYEFTAPAPGRYRFVCDFHVNMVGTFEVRG